MAPVAITRILKEDGGRHLRPMEAEVLLSCLEQSLAGLRAEGLPRSAVLNGGEGSIAVERQERGPETIGGASVGEEVALTAARSRRIGCVCER
jgi:hypothetical protein